MWSSFPYPLGLIVAFAVAALSAYATLVGSRRRFRADVLSANRQKWIDTFRDRLSELISLMNSAQVIKRMTTSGWRGGAGPVHDNPALADKLEKTFMAIAQIELLTHAGEPAQQALNEAIAVAVAYLQKDELHQDEMSACCQQIVTLGRAIIRQEWSRVKRGV